MFLSVPFYSFWHSCSYLVLLTFQPYHLHPTVDLQSCNTNLCGLLYAPTPLQILISIVFNIYFPELFFAFHDSLSLNILSSANDYHLVAAIKSFIFEYLHMVTEKVRIQRFHQLIIFWSHFMSVDGFPLFFIDRVDNKLDAGLFGNRVTVLFLSKILLLLPLWHRNLISRECTQLSKELG